MTLTEFRALTMQKLVNFVQANQPLEAFYEDGPEPDLEKVGDHWLDTEIRPYGSKIIEPGANPTVRYNGALMIRLFVRPGVGTARKDALLDGLTQEFAPQRLGAATLWKPEIMLPTHVDGWNKTGILALYSYDG